MGRNKRKPTTLRLALLGLSALGACLLHVIAGPQTVLGQTNVSLMTCTARNLTVSLAIDSSRSIASMGAAQAPAQITETQYRVRFSAEQSGIPGGVEYQINRLTGDFVVRFVTSGEVWMGACRAASRL
jgi:hypothetical protein